MLISNKRDMKTIKINQNYKVLKRINQTNILASTWKIYHRMIKYYNNQSTLTKPNIKVLRLSKKLKWLQDIHSVISKKDIWPIFQDKIWKVNMKVQKHKQKLTIFLKRREIFLKLFFRNTKRTWNNSKN
jgi:hypothetical protein